MVGDRAVRVRGVALDNNNAEVWVLLKKHVTTDFGRMSVPLLSHHSPCATSTQRPSVVSCLLMSNSTLPGGGFHAGSAAGAAGTGIAGAAIAVATWYCLPNAA